MLRSLSPALLCFSIGLGAAANARAEPAAGKTSVTEIVVAGHTIVRRDTLDSEGNGTVSLGERAGATVVPIWTGRVGWLDADHETRQVVDVTAGAIERYQLAPRIGRCDARPARLYWRRWDFAAKRFLAVKDEDAAGARVIARRMGEAQAGLPLFRFSGASASAAARGDARNLVAPTELSDGDPESSWRVERAAAAGAFVTARASGTAYPVTEVWIHADAGTPLRSVDLILGPAPAQRIRIELLDDAPGSRGPFRAVLPQPVETACVTLALGELAPGTGDVAIGEVTVRTELDAPSGLDRLARDAATGVGCEPRAALLRQAGPAAWPAVISALPHARGLGRTCLLSVATGLPAPGENEATTLVRVLVDQTLSADDDAAALGALLGRLGPAGLSQLNDKLRDPALPPAVRLRVARVMLGLGEGGVGALIDAVGVSDLRAPLRAVLVPSPRTPLGRVLAALATTPRADTVRRADLLSLAAGWLARVPTEAEDVTAAAIGALAGEVDFEVRARAVQALGAAGTPAAVTALADLRAHDPDDVLRAFAAEGLARAAVRDDARQSLRDALQDRDPRVREKAALALGRSRDSGAASVIVKAAREEPWPFARKAEVTALGALCTPEGNTLLVQAVERDRDEVRRAALSGLASCQDPRAPALLVRILGRRPESPTMRTHAAHLLEELKLPATRTETRAAFDRMLGESQADLALEETVAATLAALVATGGPAAVEAAVRSVSDPRATMKRVGIEALGRLCDAAAGRTALEQASRSADRGVAESAARALARCASPPGRE